MKLARLFLAMRATNVPSERAFSGMKRIKMYQHNSTTNNCLNHCMVVHIHTEDVDKMNMIKIAREFRRNYAYLVDFKCLSIVNEQ